VSGVGTRPGLLVGTRAGLRDVMSDGLATGAYLPGNPTAGMLALLLDFFFFVFDSLSLSRARLC
jgi:hypothetical protein